MIGGGCAGFAAATALVEAGARVLVVEARPGLGGRATAFTDPETGERVDNGQHILMGCYTETLAFLDRIGAADRVRWQTGLKLSMIDRARPSQRAGAAGVAVAAALSRRRAGVGCAELVGAVVGVADWRRLITAGAIRPQPQRNPAEADTTRLGISVRAWLRKNGQAPRLCELFWEPLALAALNQSIDQADASHFIARARARVRAGSGGGRARPAGGAARRDVCGAGARVARRIAAAKCASTRRRKS